MAFSWGSLPWGDIISTGAQIAGNVSKSRAEGRAAQAAAQQQQDIIANRGYETDKTADLSALVQQYKAALDRATGQLAEYETGLKAPQARASNAVRGDILRNVQDVSVNAPVGVNLPTISGGLRPSIFSGDTRQLGAAMSREALLSQLAGTPTPYSDLPALDVSAITSRTAPLTPLPEPSTLDTILNAINLAGTGVGITREIMGGRGGDPDAGFTEYRGGVATPSGAPATRAGQIATQERALPPGAVMPDYNPRARR